MRAWRLLLLIPLLAACSGCSPSGTLLVRVLDVETGEPITGAQVQVHNTYFLDLNPFRPKMQRATTNSNGEASFDSQFYNGPPFVVVRHAKFHSASSVHGSFSGLSSFTPPTTSDQRLRSQAMRQAWDRDEPFVDIYRIHPKQ